MEVGTSAPINVVGVGKFLFCCQRNINHCIKDVTVQKLLPLCVEWMAKHMITPACQSAMELFFNVMDRAHAEEMVRSY